MILTGSLLGEASSKFCVKGKYASNFSFKSAGWADTDRVITKSNIAP